MSAQQNNYTEAELEAQLLRQLLAVAVYDGHTVRKAEGVAEGVVDGTEMVVVKSRNGTQVMRPEHLGYDSSIAALYPVACRVFKELMALGTHKAHMAAGRLHQAAFEGVEALFVATHAAIGKLVVLQALADMEKGLVWSRGGDITGLRGLAPDAEQLKGETREYSFWEEEEIVGNGFIDKIEHKLVQERKDAEFWADSTAQSCAVHLSEQEQEYQRLMRQCERFAMTKDLRWGDMTQLYDHVVRLMERHPGAIVVMDREGRESKAWADVIGVTYHTQHNVIELLL